MVTLFLTTYFISLILLVSLAIYGYKRGERTPKDVEKWSTITLLGVTPILNFILLIVSTLWYIILQLLPRREPQQENKELEKE